LLVEEDKDAVVEVDKDETEGGAVTADSPVVDNAVISP
jgi:hypothetical protein